VNGLQTSVAEIRTRHELTEDDLYDLQHHVEALEPESDQLLTRLDAVENQLSYLSDIQDQVYDLQTRVGAESDDSLATPMTDIKACADALNALVIGLLYVLSLFRFI